jgi:hypothetical protein
LNYATALRGWLRIKETETRPYWFYGVRLGSILGKPEDILKSGSIPVAAIHGQGWHTQIKEGIVLRRFLRLIDGTVVKLIPAGIGKTALGYP